MTNSTFIDPSHSRQSSASTASDASPVSPTFSLRGHGRYASSNSSSNSLPTTHLPQPEYTITYHKSTPALPDVVEDPMERDGSAELMESTQYFEDSDRYWEQDAADDSQDYFPPYVDYDLRDGFYSDNDLSFEHDDKRRRSGDSKMNTFATRIVTRFPSLSRRTRASTLNSDTSIEAYHSTPNLGRSTSQSKSFRVRSHEFTNEPSVLALSSSQIIEEDETPELCSSPMEFGYQEDTYMHELPEPFPRSTTPILPPLMAALQCKPAVPSPLQSPSVAPRSTGISGTTTPSGTPQLSGALSPTLDSAATFGPFARLPPSPLIGGRLEEIPPMTINDPSDHWTESLGHANFEIIPEPYLPPRCDLASCSQLVKDWRDARSEYSKHYARTTTHFGSSSKILRLTEEKWVELDDTWRRNVATATAQGRRSGDLPPNYTPLEPPPVARIPTMNDPSSEGKFPKLGDDDIVGPMVQAAPMVQYGRGSDGTRGARKGLMKLLGRLPGRMSRSLTE